MQMRNLVLGAAVVITGLAAGDAFAVSWDTSGTQTPLPIARPAPGAYTFGIYAATGGAPPMNPQFGAIGVGRDDLSPFCEFTLTVNAGYLPAPFAAAGGYRFTYRPELDPNQVQLPAAPATNVDQMANWVAVQTIYQAMVDCRTRWNQPAVGSFRLWIDPATASIANMGQGNAVLQNEFYKCLFVR